MPKTTARLMRIAALLVRVLGSRVSCAKPKPDLPIPQTILAPSTQISFPHRPILLELSVSNIFFKTDITISKKLLPPAEGRDEEKSQCLSPPARGHLKHSRKTGAQTGVILPQQPAQIQHGLPIRFDPSRAARVGGLFEMVLWMVFPRAQHRIFALAALRRLRAN